MGLIASRTKNDTDVIRANEYRAALLDTWLEKKENIDTLPASLKEEARKYLALSDVAKREQSAKYWTIVDTGIEMHK